MPGENVGDERESTHRRLKTLQWARDLILPDSASIALEQEIAQIEDGMASAPPISRLHDLAPKEPVTATVPPPLPPSPRLRVVSMDDIRRFEEQQRSTDKDVRQRNEKTLKELKRRGEWRALKRLPRTWPKRLDELERQFPNFTALIEFLRVSFFASTRQSASAVQFDPVLLAGAPGTGKTMITERLAHAFDLPFIRLDMAAAQSPAALTGSDIFWSNSQPGRLFEALALGDVANPMVQLDELSRAQTDDRYPPTAGMYTLFEKRTAAAFEDLSYPGIRLDASRVLFVGTCNDPQKLDNAILDRMRVFEIGRLTDAAMENLVLAAVRDHCKKLRIRAAQLAVHPDSMAQLIRMSPRTAVRLVQEAVARAAMTRAAEVSIPQHNSQSQRRSIGFTA